MSLLFYVYKSVFFVYSITMIILYQMTSKNDIKVNLNNLFHHNHKVNFYAL